MTNKQVIDILSAYLKKQNHDTVAQLAANLFCDMNRYLHFDTLSEEDKDSLLKRNQFNVQQVYDLAMNPGDGEKTFELYLQEWDELNHG